MMISATDQWERFLDPEMVRPSLFMAAMFITAFEILKDSIVSDVREFYTNGFDESGPTVGDEYQIKVLSRNRSPLYASLQWLRENGAIGDEDLAIFEKLKLTRNQLAHELFAVVTGQVESAYEAQFTDLVTLLRKIGVWWVVNVEVPTNPDFNGQEGIDEANIVPGTALVLQMFIEVATGNTELLERWRKGRTEA